MPKNIVICCDGTNNEIVGDQTNVLRLYRMLSQNERQIAFYDPGVGTKSRSDGSMVVEAASPQEV